VTESSPGSAAVAEPRPPSDAGDPRHDGPPARGFGRFVPRSSRIVFGGLAILFVALSLYSTLTSQPGRYIPDAHIEDAMAPAENLSRQAYLWDDAKSLGKPRQAFGFTPVTAGAEAGLSALGVSGWAIQRLMSALYVSLAAIGVILLLREFLPRVGLAHGLAAFVYAFSPYTAQSLLVAPLFLTYALAPWFAWFALRGVRDGDPWRWAAAFALAVAAVGTWNAAALGYALLPAALVALYLPLYERRGFAPLWRWTWRAALLSALVWLPALIVLFASHAEISANLRTTELPESVARTSTWSESWRGLGNWVTYLFSFAEGLNRPQTAAYFTAPDVILASFVASVGALIALALGRWRFRLLFGLMLLVSLVLMVGINEDASPYGWLLSFAYDHSEFAKGFRATYKAGTGLMLAIAILLGAGVAAMVRAAARDPDRGLARHSRRARFRRLSLGILLPVLVAQGVLVASYPFWTGGLYSDDTGFKSLPPYWERTFEYLEEQERPGRVLMLPSADSARYRWGSVQNSLFDGFSSLTPVTSRPLPQGTAQSADLVAALNEYVDSPGYVKGTLGPILARLGVRWVLLQNDLDWRAMRVPRPSTYAALRDDPGLRRVATFGRPGENTFAADDDVGAGLLGESSLPPVELYEVDGNPSPRPRVEGGPPLLVEGGGDSWPALAAAGLLDGPPVAYTGAAEDEDLDRMVAAGADLVVTDGNRRRLTATTKNIPFRSPTLAPSEPTARAAGDLFHRRGTQSLATYRDAAWITATRYGFPWGPYEAAARPASAFDNVPRTAWTVRGPLDPNGESLTVQLREPTTVTAASVLPRGVGPWRVKAVDVIFHTEDGGQTSERLHFGRAPSERDIARVASGVTSIELRIAEVAGPGPVGLSGVGIAEARVVTPDGPLDLREFVRTPEDVADRAARDGSLGAKLAADPPRYELRRVTGVSEADEETELRREITTFGTHRYQLSATARLASRAVDSAIDGLLGKSAGAEGSSRIGGRRDRRCAPLFAVDGRPIYIRLPRPKAVLSGRVIRLQGCRPIRLGPGRHRIESLSGLSGAVLGTSLVPLGEKLPRGESSRPTGEVKVVDRSPTRLDLRVEAPKDALLLGSMPYHRGWEADGDNLRPYPIPLDTFSAWTVDAPTTASVTLSFKPQRTYELAMALSIAVAIWCLWRATRRRRSPA
jgi:hypothetical protein